VIPARYSHAPADDMKSRRRELFSFCRPCLWSLYSQPERLTRLYTIPATAGKDVSVIFLQNIAGAFCIDIAIRKEYQGITWRRGAALSHHEAGGEHDQTGASD